MYKSILCISRPPILGPKNKFFIFLSENFLENVSFVLEFSFRCTMVTRKSCPELSF